MSKHYILAMYDVRGKQNFIYRSRKCKEIIGGSHIISDAFEDYLYPAAKSYRNRLSGKGMCEKEAIYHYTSDSVKGVESFSAEAFESRMNGEDYIGEVVYEGGGNFLILYRNVECCIETNKIFTRNLMEKVDTLRVLCSFVEISDFHDYQTDRSRLYNQHRIQEAQELTSYPINTLPFAEISPETGRPYTAMAVKTMAKGLEKVTTEQKAKYAKYEEYIAGLKGTESYDREEFLLDELVTEKGEESLLAVIYIDGNSMGAKVQACLDGLSSYEDCVTRLRQFSAEIERDYVQERIEAINQMLTKKHEGKKEKVRRTIVAAGDEMTIICNARDALDVVKAYFENMDAGTSCAGVAVFHSHAPYSDAYRIAEECCENGKSMMKKAEVQNVNLLDFHYCQSGIGFSLEQIRQREYGGELFSKPWLLRSDEKSGITVSPVFEAEDFRTGNVGNLVNEMAEQLRKLGRSNVKTLRQTAERSSADLEMELRRINAHRPKEDQIDFSLSGKLKTSDQKRKLIYDITVVYDLWFRAEVSV